MNGALVNCSMRCACQIWFFYLNCSYLKINRAHVAHNVLRITNVEIVIYAFVYSVLYAQQRIFVHVYIAAHACYIDWASGANLSF